MLFGFCEVKHSRFRSLLIHLQYVRSRSPIAYVGEEVFGADLSAFEHKLQSIERRTKCVALAERRACSEWRYEGERPQAKLFDGVR